jgi:integrase/recombinase XerD
MFSSPLSYEGYLGHKLGLGQAPGTVQSHRVALASLAKWLQGADLREVSSEDLKSYADSLKAKLTPQTAYRYLSAVKSFFRFLADRHEILIDPAEGLLLPRLSGRARLVGPTLSEDETRRLLGVCDVKTPLGLRNRALLEFLYSTVLRVSEIGRVKLSDLVSDGRDTLVFVHQGKGAKDRVIPLGRVAARWLTRYLEDSRPVLAKYRPDADALFISCRGRLIQSFPMGRLILGLGKKAGLSISLTCHVIRRTVATSMLRNGAPPQAVAGLLGHGDLQSLSRYVASAGAEIRKVHHEFHPREAERE